VTAYGSENLSERAGDHGLDAFLTKPVNPSTMVDTLMEVFRGRSRGRATYGRSEDAAELVRGIRGARILLAEDNDLNQQVAIELLEGAGLSVTLAIDGEEAVQKMRADFHAVLMDVQMPNMDGYEATRLIRSKPAFDDIPIIAMTANSMEQDLVLARAAGMVSHVAKPVDPAKLYATLAEFIKPDPAKPFDERDPDAPRVHRNPAAGDRSSLPESLPGIDLEDGLGHLAGNAAVYARLLGQFPERQGGTATAIRTALSGGRNEEATRLAHSLKSVAGNLGALGLCGASRDVEAALKEGRDAEASISAMETALREAVTGLEAWQAARGAVPHQGTRLDSSAPGKRLAELEAMLRDDDTAAIGVIDELSAALDPGSLELLAEMRKQAESYDFAAVLASLPALRAGMTSEKIGNEP